MNTGLRILVIGLLFFCGRVSGQTVGQVTVVAQSTATYGTAATIQYIVTITKMGSGGLSLTSFNIPSLPIGAVMSASFSPATISIGGSAGSTGTTYFTLTTNTVINAISSPYSFNVNFTANGINSTAPASLVIGKKNLTITGLTANNKIYDRNTAASINTGGVALSGVVSPDVVTLSSASATGVFSDKNVGTNKTVATSGFTISGTGAGNYNLIQPTTTANITAASLTPSFTANDKIYDGFTSAVIATRALTGVISGDAVIISGGAATFSDKNVGTTKTVTGTGFALSGTDAGNYIISPSSVTATANITAAALSITPNLQTKAYGTTFTFTGTEFTSSGLKNGETIGSVSLVSVGTPANASATVYSITAASAAGGTFTASNYNITYNTTNTFTVAKSTLTITALNQSKVYGNMFSFTGTEFTSSGLQNGETIGSVTLISGGSVASAAVTSYTITPSAATGGTFTASNYNIVYNNGNIVVNKADLTITADDRSKTFGTALTSGTGSTAYKAIGLQNGNTLTTLTIGYGTGSLAAAAVGTYANTITPSAVLGANGYLASNYNIIYAAGDIIVNTANLTITANNVNKTYGALLTGGSSASFTSIGLVSTNTLTSVTIAYGTGAAATAPVSTYNGSVAASAAVGGSGFLASNYNITYVTGNIIVGAANLTITAAAQSKLYGAVFSFVGTEFTTNGLVNGETVGSVTLGSTGSPATAGVGAYPITLSAATGGTFTTANYAITYTNGTLTVNKADLTITADDRSKTFGTALTGITGSTAFTSSGLQNGNTLTTLTIGYGTGSSTAAAVGTYANTVTASAVLGANGYLASNYNIVYVTGNIIVSAANLIITANNVNKTYGTSLTGVAGSTAFLPSGLQNGNTIGSVIIAYSTGAAATAGVGTYSGSVAASSASGGTFTASN
ncbi:MAG: MBG domain-containing protein [Ferruginibacter sp.]